MLPSINEVFSKADACRGASDGNLAVIGALNRVGDLDLCSRHLTYLIYLGTLTANDAANQLHEKKFTQLVCFAISTCSDEVSKVK